MRVSVFLISIIFPSLLFAHENKVIEFPNLYQGVWDVSQKACKDKWSDARLTITASSIQYWESSGVIVRIYSNSSNTLNVKLSMNGEGETWFNDSKYSVIGSKLTEHFEKYDSFTRVLCEKMPNKPLKQDK